MAKIPRATSSAQGEDDEWEPIAADDPSARIPAGEYDVFCTRAERRFYAVFHRSAIVLSLKIESEPYGGITVERYYNIPRDGKIRRGSDYFREWVLANEGLKPLRRERMAKKKFVDKLFRARVITVTKNRLGQNLDASLAYSKVCQLLELLVSNEDVAR